MAKPQKIIAEIYKNVNKKKWECLVDGCSETAINSHLIQQNGILNNISVDGHLIELKMLDAYKWTKNKWPFDFRSVGIKQALSQNIFCNSHDARIFNTVENSNNDFESYETFLLFSYRAVCAEISKKRLAIEQYNRVINASTLAGRIDKYTLQQIVKGNELGIKDLQALKKELEDELEINTGKYTYYAYKYRKISVYASAVFSATDIDIPKVAGELDLENIYIHVLPFIAETLIIVGFHNNYTSSDTKEYCKSWEGLSYKELQFKLTGLFAANIENWRISPDLFKNIPAKNKSQYIELYRKNVTNNGISHESKFNLFEVK